MRCMGGLLHWPGKAPDMFIGPKSNSAPRGGKPLFGARKCHRELALDKGETHARTQGKFNSSGSWRTEEQGCIDSIKSELRVITRLILKATVISIISLLARKQHTEPNNRVPPANLSGGTLFSNRPVSQSNSGNKTSSDAFRRTKRKPNGQGKLRLPTVSARPRTKDMSRAIQSLTILLAGVTLCFLALCWAVGLPQPKESQNKPALMTQSCFNSNSCG